jgi:transposase
MTAPTFACWTQLLDLPDYEVAYCQKESDLQRYRITAAPKHRLGVCSQCGIVSDIIHQTRTRERVQDLSLGQESVELNVRELQFECACGQHFTPAVPFWDDGAHATERFIERAAQLIRTSNCKGGWRRYKRWV